MEPVAMACRCPFTAAICPGYREALEGVLLSKMCTALKEPILIEWGPFRIPSSESSFEPLASVVANALTSQCLFLGLE
jgi:hypothetical protein